MADELRRNGLLEMVGGDQVLLDIMASTPATTSAGGYARIIEEHALLRRLIGVAGEIAEIGYGMPEDVTKALDRAESMVYDVNQRRVTDTTSKIEDLLGLNLDRLEQLYGRGDAITGVPTGYVDLDDLLSGLQPSNLVIVGARPAMGKCVAFDTPIVDPATGDVRTAAELHRAGTSGQAVSVLTLDDERAVTVTRPSAFVDDGIKRVYRVRTRGGREVRTTASHPFLTPSGWVPLADLAPGRQIGVPAAVPVFGGSPMPVDEVGMLAHLVMAPGSDERGPRLWTESREVATDIEYRGAPFGVRVHDRTLPGGGRTWDVTCGDAAVRAGPPARRGRRPRGTAHPRGGVPAATRAARPLPQPFARCGGVGLAAAARRPRSGGRAHPQPAAGRRPAPPAAPLRRGRRRRALGGGGRPGHLVGPRDRGVAGSRPWRGWRPRSACSAARPSSARSSPMHRAVADAEREGAMVGAGGPDRAQRGGGTAVIDGPSRIDRGGPTAGDGAVLWDEIVAIDDDGDVQVYDLTVPDTHNFVAADVFVHNTSFALGMASHAALHANKPVLLFSLEMGSLELSQRLLSAEARIDSKRVRTGQLSEDDWSRISQAIGRLAAAPIWIDDNPNLTVMEIRSKARRLKSQVGDLGMVVVDYLQLMTGRSNAENRQVEVSEMSRGLKILARELETPVVALSQLSRQLELRADKRPMLADLRESGSIEQDADVVMFIYRDDVYHGDSPDRGQAEIIVAKHRNGPTGVARLAFLEQFTRFANMAKVD